VVHQKAAYSVRWPGFGALNHCIRSSRFEQFETICVSTARKAAGRIQTPWARYRSARGILKPGTATPTVQNNPMSYTDPTGLMAVPDMGGGGGEG